MKKALFFLLLALPAVTYAQQSAVGRVTEQSGKYVFYYTKPVAAYDVAFTFSTPPMSACGTGSERASAALDAALREAGAQQKPFDALLIGAGERDAAIRFRRRTDTDSMALCRPWMVGGTAVYFMAEPVTAWKPLAQQKTVWWDGVVTGQCLTGGQVVERSLRKMKNPKSLIITDRTTYSAD